MDSSIKFINYWSKVFFENGNCVFHKKVHRCLEEKTSFEGIFFLKLNYYFNFQLAKNSHFIRTQDIVPALVIGQSLDCKKSNFESSRRGRRFLVLIFALSSERELHNGKLIKSGFFPNYFNFYESYCILKFSLVKLMKFFVAIQTFCPFWCIAISFFKICSNGINTIKHTYLYYV